MEDNNNQSTPEFEKKNPIVEKLKQVKKKTLYIWIAALAISLGIFVGVFFGQSEAILEAQNTIESMNEEIDRLNEQYDLLASDKESLEEQIAEYEDQQKTIDELTAKLTDLQTQYDALKAENDKLKAENESLKSQLAEKTSETQSYDSNDSWGYEEADSGEMVWLSETGSKYHSISDCGRMNPNNAWQVSKSSAEAQGYDACKKCY